MNATEKIKVLLLDTNDQMGGVVRVHLDLLHGLDRGQFDVHLACLRRGRLLPLFQAIPGVTLWPIEAGTKSRAASHGWRARLADLRSLPVFFWQAMRLAMQCRRAGIQVIHASDKKRSVILASLLHRLTGIPFVYHIHNHLVYYPANRRALREAAAIIANSADMRRDFIHWLGPEMERIGVIYNGIDAGAFLPDAPSTLRAEIGAAADDVLIGVVSRLAPDKGQETFLRAAALAAAQAPQARFVLAGDDAIFSDNADFVPMLRRLAGELGIAARTHFLGYRADMANVYGGLDAVVNAAWREAFGMVVVEAMACGKPVAGTAAGGIPEILTHGLDGFLYPPRDEQKLAKILVELVRRPDLRRAVGAAARQTVVERFTIQGQVRAVEKVYADLVHLNKA